MEQKKNYPKTGNPLVYLLKKTWHYSFEGRKNVVKYWIMFICSNTVVIFFEPFMWAGIIKVITQDGISNVTIVKLFMLLGGYFLSSVSSWIFHGPARIIERTNAFKVRANYKKYLVRGVFNLDMKWHADHHSGDTIDKIEKGTESLYGFSSQVFMIISGLFRLLGSYAVLAYFSLPAAILVLLMVVITFWVTVRFDRVIMDQHKQLNHYENRITENIFDTVGNIVTVITLRAEKKISTMIAAKIDEPYKLYKKHSINVEWKWFITSMCCNVMIVLVLGIYFWQHMNAPKGTLVASVYLLFNYLDTISDLFYQFTSQYGDIIKHSSKIANSEELTLDFTQISYTNHHLPKNWNKISATGLTFSYQGENPLKNELDNISFEIKRGQRIACIGKTGSGKTTFLKIIRDLYRPCQGNIYVDGVLQKNGFTDIGGGISLIPQEAEIFGTTVLANITFSKEHGYDAHEVQNAMRVSCFDEVLENLPNGLDTSINEKGVNLSGGQKQRLALARGIYASSESQIILLDEPTSSLDPLTEYQVYKNIFENCSPGIAIISTVHRFHLLPLFDEIIFFEKGKIIAQGTYRELLLNSKFLNMVEKTKIAQR